MARQRDRVRVARVLRALLVGALGSGAATVLFEQDFGRDLVVPLWAVTWAPPAFYLLLALVALRHTPAGRRLGWAVATCGVNAVSRSHHRAGAVVRPSDVVCRRLHPGPVDVRAGAGHPSGDRAARDVRVAQPRPSADDDPAGSFGDAAAVETRAPPLPIATPNWDAVLHEVPASTIRGRLRSNAPARQPERVERRPVHGPSEPNASERTERTERVERTSDASRSRRRSQRPVAAAPESPRPLSMPFVQPPPPPADEPLTRISFDRIATQLPPDVFVLPPARLSESLREPHVVTVPSRHVLPHLADGAIDIPWAVIEYQFPEMAFALPQAEVRRRFAGWHLSLPMDEVLSQAPPELWRVDVPAPDLTALNQFPAPFALGEAAPASQPTPAAVAAAPPAPAARRRRRAWHRRVQAPVAPAVARRVRGRRAASAPVSVAPAPVAAPQRTPPWPRRRLCGSGGPGRGGAGRTGTGCRAGDSRRRCSAAGPAPLRRRWSQHRRPLERRRRSLSRPWLPLRRRRPRRLRSRHRGQRAGESGTLADARASRRQRRQRPRRSRPRRTTRRARRWRGH